MNTKRNTVTKPRRPSWTPRPPFTHAHFFGVLGAIVAVAVMLVSLMKLAAQ
jgi:hypothetical protein